jgi:hypothetical protein
MILSCELIEYLLNLPSTEIEHEVIRLSNDLIRFKTCQLILLCTNLFSLRLNKIRTKSFSFT